MPRVAFPREEAPMRAKHVAFWLMGIVLTIAVTLVLAPDVSHAQGSDTAEITLEPGWNLVSLPLAPDDGSLPAVLGAAAAQVDRVMAYDTAEPAGPWLAYSPTLPPYANDLTVVDETMGLWVHATQAVTWVVTGTQPLETVIPLHAGWNLIGYPSSVSRPIEPALSEIASVLVEAQACDTGDTADPWKRYVPGAGTGDLISMES
jgi:hypothetical protein